MRRFLYLPKGDLRTEPHTGIITKCLFFFENVRIEAKMWLRIVTTLWLRKCRILCENSLTNNDKFFQLMPCQFVVTVRLTTEHYIVWGLWCVFVFLLEEQRRQSLEPAIKCLPVVPTELGQHRGYRVRLK
jgi:hypothetical protein